MRDDSGMSHLMRAQLGFLCGVNPALRNSEHFDELSARIFLCRVTPALRKIREIRQAVVERVTVTLGIAFNLDTDVVCVFLGKDGAVNIGEDEAIHLRLDVGEDGELRTERWKVQFLHFLIELLWQELDIGLECLGYKQNPQ